MMGSSEVIQGKQLIHGCYIHGKVPQPIFLIELALPVLLQQ